MNPNFSFEIVNVVERIKINKKINHETEDKNIAYNPLHATALLV